MSSFVVRIEKDGDWISMANGKDLHEAFVNVLEGTTIDMMKLGMDVQEARRQTQDPVSDIVDSIFQNMKTNMYLEDMKDEWQRLDSDERRAVRDAWLEIVANCLNTD